MKNVWKGIAEETRGYRILIVVVFLILCGMASFLIADTYRGPQINAENAGLFGDFIGGCFGTIFSIVGVFLLIVTIREQRLNDKDEAFENKYFQLLRIHRDNVTEMSTTKEINGRKCFVYAFRELQLAYTVIDRTVPETKLVDKIQLAYLVVFYGIGIVSSRSYRAALKTSGVRMSDAVLDDVERQLDRARERHHQYKYFDGHQSRLGHYYRHLFQLVTFVDEHGGDEKKGYIKTIRAQLSTHEQVFLLINSLTSLGWPWWRDGFMTEYSLVKNIPSDYLSGLGNLDLVELFGNDYFEWQELRLSPEILSKVQTSSPREKE